VILSPSRKIRTGLIAAIAAAGRRGPAAVLLCLLLLVPALFTAGCGSSGKKAASGSGDLPNLGKARLKLWNTMTPTESEAFASVLTEFKIKYPDIEIDVENVAFSQARAKYEQATKTGTGPDIFRSDRFWLKDFAKQSIVEPFDTAGMEEELDDLLPLARDVVTIDGKLWGVPHTLDCLGLFYNKSHFKDAGITQPPEDFDTFRETARKLTDPGRGRYGFFLHPEGWWFEPFLFGFGGRYYDPSGNLSIQSDQTLKALHFLIDFKEADKSVPPVNVRNDAYSIMMQSFKSGQVSMILNGPWSIRDILAGQAFKDDTSNLGVAPVPRGPVDRHSPMGCQSFVIGKGCKYRPEAQAFIRFICSPVALSVFIKRTYGLPARRALFNDPEIKNDPYLSPFILQLQTMKSTNDQPRDGSIYGPIGDHLALVINGDLAPEDAMRDMESVLKKHH